MDKKEKKTETKPWQCEVCGDHWMPGELHYTFDKGTPLERQICGACWSDKLEFTEGEDNGNN